MVDDDQDGAVATQTGSPAASSGRALSRGQSNRTMPKPSTADVGRSLNDTDVATNQPDFVKALKAREAEFLARVHVGKRLDTRSLARTGVSEKRQVDGASRATGNVDSEVDEDGPAMQGSTEGGGGGEVAAVVDTGDDSEQAVQQAQQQAEPEVDGGPDIPPPVPPPPSGGPGKNNGPGAGPELGSPLGTAGSPGAPGPSAPGSSGQPGPAGMPTDPNAPKDGTKPGDPGAAPGGAQPGAPGSEPEKKEPEQQQDSKPPVQLLKKAAMDDADMAIGAEIEAGWWEVVAWAYGFCWLVFPVILLAIGLDIYWYFFHSSNPKRFRLDFEQRIVTIATNFLAALILFVVTLLIAGAGYYMCQSWQVTALNLFGVNAPQKICTFFSGVTTDLSKSPAIVAGVSTGGPLNTVPSVLSGVGRAAAGEDRCVVETIARAETAAGKTPLEAQSLATSLLQGVENQVPALRANAIFVQYEALRGSPSSDSLQKLYEICTLTASSTPATQTLNVR